MGVQERRNKLLEQFQMIIQDEHNMAQLEAMFQSILHSENSSLTENQIQQILKIREQVDSGEMDLTPWSEVKSRLDKKYGV